MPKRRSWAHWQAKKGILPGPPLDSFGGTAYALIVGRAPDERGEASGGTESLMAGSTDQANALRQAVLWDPASGVVAALVRLFGRRPEFRRVVSCARECLAMPTGTIKKIVQDKGFGFISTSDGVDVFFHHSTVADQQFDDLEVGQQVEYTLDGEGKGGKGPRAASVAPQ